MDYEKIDYLKVNEILDKYGVNVVMEMALILETKGAKSLQHNIRKEVFEDLEYIRLSITMPGYAEFADHGRKGGKFPPKDKIQMWCVSRSIPVKKSFVIARNIARYGTNGKDFLKIFYEYYPKIKQDLIKAIKSDYAIHLRKLLIK